MSVATGKTANIGLRVTIAFKKEDRDEMTNGGMLWYLLLHRIRVEKGDNRKFPLRSGEPPKAVSYDKYHDSCLEFIRPKAFPITNFPFLELSGHIIEDLK